MISRLPAFCGPLLKCPKGKRSDAVSHSSLRKKARKQETRTLETTGGGERNTANFKWWERNTERTLDLSSLCHAANFYRLSVFLHLVIHVFQCYPLNLFHPLLSPLCPPNTIL